MWKAKSKTFGMVAWKQIDIRVKSKAVSAEREIKALAMLGDLKHENIIAFYGKFMSDNGGIQVR